MLGASAIAILHSLGTLALMSVGISMLQRHRPDRVGRTVWSLVTGLVFGTAASVAMLDPLVLAPGLIFDTRAAPILLSGVYGGPGAAAATAVLAAATRWWLGGGGAPVGTAVIALHAVAGILAGWYLRRRRIRPGILLLAGYAILATLGSFPLLFLVGSVDLGLQILSGAWWVMLSCNLFGVLVLGMLLEQDHRRQVLEHDLRVTEAQSRAATEAKTRFLASMSHEIRTPMNAVIGFVDLLRDSRLDGFQRRCADQIRDAATGLLRIIDDILDFAKIDAGSVVLEPQSVDVVELVEGCRGMLLPQLEAKGLACTVERDGPLPTAVSVDPIRLRQVLLNLLGNAVKFTDSGRITVTVGFTPDPAAAVSGELAITVADTGIGITPAEQARLFSPFAQGDHIGRGGTGLGLVISRMLVQAMGGELTLESAPGAGTTVALRMPVRRAAPATPPEPPAIATADSGTPQRRRLRILVAEDVPLNAEMLQATLEQTGHEVHLAQDGQEALDAMRTATFDIVLMDVQMPVMDGLAATRAIRALGGPPAAVPIIALTAYASRNDLKTCLDAGMNDFLTKPLERSKLQDVLERWTESESGAGRDQPPARPPALTGDAGHDLAPGGDGGERIAELLDRLGEIDRDDRDAVRALADNLASAADGAGHHALAERARRLVAASARSNAEALSALIEDTVDTGRRSLPDGPRPGAVGDGR